MTKRISYRAGYKYQLAETYGVQTAIRPGEYISTEYIDLDLDGRLIILRGFAWDGPSGPAIDTTSFMRGSLIHDSLYQLIRMGLLDQRRRVVADQELRRICLEDGMWKVRAWWVYRAVRRAAGGAAKASARKQVRHARRRKSGCTVIEFLKKYFWDALVGPRRLLNHLHPGLHNRDSLV